MTTQTEQRPTDEQVCLNQLAKMLREQGKTTSAEWCEKASAKIGELMRALDEFIADKEELMDQKYNG